MIFYVWIISSITLFGPISYPNVPEYVYIIHWLCMQKVEYSSIIHHHSRIRIYCMSRKITSLFLLSYKTYKYELHKFYTYALLVYNWPHFLKICSSN